MDPIPGSPVLLRAVAAGWVQVAQTQRSAGDQLQLASAQLPGVWRDSPGADALGHAVLVPARPIGAVADQLNTAAAVLSGYADRLDELQTRSLVLAGAVDAAQHRVSFDAQANARLPIESTASPRYLADAAGRADLCGAQAALADTRRDLAAAGQSAHEAALLAARALDDAASVLAGWESGRAFGPCGPPPEGTLTGSRAFAGYSAPWVSNHAAAVPADPVQAARWWADLDLREQARFAADLPAVVGNADGLPAQVRDRANRSVLGVAAAELHRRVSLAGHPLPDQLDVSTPDGARAMAGALAAIGVTGAERDRATNTLVTAGQLRVAQARGRGRPVTLLAFDPAAFDGKGRAIVALGDVSQAGNVSVLIPGMTSDVSGYLDDAVTNAGNLLDQRIADGAGPGTDAVVAYLGYHAPGLGLAATDQGLARAGARLVAGDLAGLRAMRTAGPARVTAIAHSYGSVTLANALVSAGARVDAAVLIGSPGAGPARTAAALNLPPGSVFVGAASGDPVTTNVQVLEYGLDRPQLNQLVQVFGPPSLRPWYATGVPDSLPGGLGVDPAGSKFGAIRFHAETQDKYTLRMSNHSQYYTPGTESLRNIAKIVAGRTAAITTGSLRPEPLDHYAGVDPEFGHLPDR